MRRARWISIAVLSLLFVVGPAGIAQAQSYEPEEQQFLELINQYRAENGLQPLALSSPLSVASERHSEDMGTYGFFSHTTEGSSYYPVGSGHPERIAQEGYDYNTYTAENLAYGQTTAAEVFEAWRISPDHNVNMLGDYKVIGIGLAWVNGTPYWTTDFGAYVDPSASGGAAPTGNTTEAADPAPANPAPADPASQPAAKETASDPATTQKPEVTIQTTPDTASEIISDPTASNQKESAAADQYAAKQSSGRNAEKKLAGETAAAAQYAESDSREAAGETGPVAVESAPAEPDNANTGTKRVEA
ncbi:MAG TPA: CAP domain-containing protein, partial [Rubrobacteraceae bacterium]|nr:CAP domain-containing protein [Rubrobacteraceae bacterium]